MRVSTIAVLHQGQDGAETPTLAGALTLRDRLCAALQAQGFSTLPVYLDPQFRWVDTLRRAQVDLIFNAADLGLFYDIKLEPHIAAILEWIGRPFTGSSCIAGLLTGDKYYSKLLLRLRGIPTPKCYRVQDLEQQPIEFPLILKARYGHNSEGISDRSVVYDHAQLMAALAEARQTQVELIAEEYIDGDEISAGFIGTKSRVVLPFYAIEFGEAFAGRPKILNFSAKWQVDSQDYVDSMPAPSRHPKQLTDQIARQLLQIAELFRINDYGRCDFRIRRDRQGREHACVIDINTNPDINQDAGLYRMAAAIGFSYPAFIGELVKAAAERYWGDAP